MNRRQKIIVSITVIFIVMLALVGLTYAYFLTRITGNEEEKSISVTTANLELRYDDVTEDITLDGVLPNTTRTKTFTVTNNGNAKVNDYQVYLENVVNELDRKDDLVYTITCESSDEQNSPCTNEIDEETTFPSTNGTILTNSLDTNDVHTYTLTLTYKEMNVDQSIDMNKKISAKINIYDKNDLNTLTLGHYILSNGAQVLNANTNELEIDKTYVEKTLIRKVSDGKDMTDVGIFTAPDDYGTSYYYRGPVKNNYVDFAGFTWRIVRINGDGSIRLILDGTLDKICVEYNEDRTCKTYAGTTSVFNSLYDNNTYIGYMYGLALSDTENIEKNRCLKLNGTSIEDYITNYSTKEACETNGGKWTTNSYEATHANVANSILKTNVDTFYEKYIKNGTTKQYEQYLADTMFCGDKSLADSSIGSNNMATGYGTGTDNKTYYAAIERLRYSSGTTTTSTSKPTLRCAEGEINTYSRYTVERQNINNVSTNGDLIYPIAVLSADELVLAGAFIGRHNQSYYLYDAYEKGTSHYHWWTLTSEIFSGSYIYSFIAVLDPSRGNSIASNSNRLSGVSVRPVINLKSNLLIESGDGTEVGPYVLKAIN